MTDNVNSPTHYKLNPHGIEAIDAIQASMSAEEFQGYLKGNVMKYLWRYKMKGKPAEDLKKAQWYHTRLMKEIAQEIEEAAPPSLDYHPLADVSPAPSGAPPSPVLKQDIVDEWLEMQRTKRNDKTTTPTQPGFGRVRVEY